jgi:hypothetical protein
MIPVAEGGVSSSSRQLFFCPTHRIGYNHCKCPETVAGREAIQDTEGAAKRNVGFFPARMELVAFPRI